MSRASRIASKFFNMQGVRGWLNQRYLSTHVLVCEIMLAWESSFQTMLKKTPFMRCRDDGNVACAPVFRLQSQ
jgi:hypothetical protein